MTEESEILVADEGSEFLSSKKREVGIVGKAAFLARGWGYPLSGSALREVSPKAIS